jgi:hypothetical protein
MGGENVIHIGALELTPQLDGEGRQPRTGSACAVIAGEAEASRARPNLPAVALLPEPWPAADRRLIANRVQTDALTWKSVARRKFIVMSWHGRWSKLAKLG